MNTIRKIVPALFIFAASVNAIWPFPDDHLNVLVTRYTSANCEHGTNLDREDYLGVEVKNDGDCYQWDDGQTFESIKWWISTDDRKDIAKYDFCGIQTFSDTDCEEITGAVPDITRLERQGTCANNESPEGYRPLLPSRSIKIKCDDHPWYEDYRMVMFYPEDDEVVVVEEY